MIKIENKTQQSNRKHTFVAFMAMSRTAATAKAMCHSHTHVHRHGAKEAPPGPCCSPELPACSALLLHWREIGQAQRREKD